MSKILITRALGSGQRFVDDFCSAYGEVYFASFCFEPMIEIERCASDVDFDDYDVLLATSQNAFSRGLSDKKIYSIGTQGLQTVADLIEFIKKQSPDDRYLYLRGEDVSFDLASHLQAEGFYVDEVIVYKAKASKILTDSLIKTVQSGELSALTFFSTRTAQIFMKLSQENDLFQYMKNIKVLSISNGVLNYAYSEFFDDVRVASKPSAQGMMDLIKDFTDEHSK